MILQQALTGKKLADEIRSLVADYEKLNKMESAGRKLSRGDAAAAVADLIEELANRRQ
jgi:UDP-N-acetylglucosamine:LPS N-acetylglucosamine transferase